MDLHAVVLVEGDLVRVEDVQPASDRSEVAGEDEGLGQVVVRVGGTHKAGCYYQEFSHFVAMCWGQEEWTEFCFGSIIYTGFIVYYNQVKNSGGNKQILI